MRVSVRFQSYLSSLVGTQQVEITLPEAASVADLSLRLQEMYPTNAPLLARITYLVDQKGVTPETALTDGAKVLALMSLSGG